MPELLLGERLEELYRVWHRPSFIGTDPLQLVREQATLADREIAALVASSLAMGRASAIVPAARAVLEGIASAEGSLAEAVRSAQPGQWDRTFATFRYRFFSGGQLAALLDITGALLRQHGTLQGVWQSLPEAHHGWARVGSFASQWTGTRADLGLLLPVAGSSGAFKRLNLFLRWLVRHDELDPGGWTCLSPVDLFMPVDTHVLQWARREGLTWRKTADRLACLEITEGLRALSPRDPLRWDFSITRQGMADKKTLLKL